MGPAAIERDMVNDNKPGTSGGASTTSSQECSPVEVRTGEKETTIGRIAGLRWLSGWFRNNFVDPLVSSGNPPWLDARGIAVGLALGFGVPVGGQMVLLALLRLWFRFNTVAAFAFTWVNNPFTLIPMYYGYYYIGSMILGRPIALTGESFRQLMTPVIHAGHFWESFQGFAELGWDIVQRWAVTAGILGFVSGVLGYVVGYHIQKAHCMRRAQAMGTSYDTLLRELEEAAVNRKRTWV